MALKFMASFMLGWLCFGGLAVYMEKAKCSKCCLGTLTALAAICFYAIPISALFCIWS